MSELMCVKIYVHLPQKVLKLPQYSVQFLWPRRYSLSDFIVLQGVVQKTGTLGI